MLELLVAACLASVDGGAEPVVVAEDAGVVDAGAVSPLADSPYGEVDAGTLAPASGVLAAGADAERRDGKAEFVKGELSVYLGSDRLTVKNTRIGVTVGPDFFAGALYALIEPLVDLRFFDGKLGIGVGVPLRIELVNLALMNPIERIGRLRIEDYDSVHDFGRILKYVTFGRKEDNIYISAGQRYASSVGHGAITRRYSPSIDTDYPRASAQVDMYNDYGGFELMTNDLLEWNQLSGLAFIKPFSFFKPQNLLLKSLSIGVTGAVDWKAPYSLSGVPTQRVTMANRLAITSVKPVTLIGVDAEIKVVKTENVDIKPYVDYSMLINGDGGFTAGVLGRFNVGTDIKNAFRVIAEARFLGNRYAPSYFDTFYEIDRMAYLNADFRDPGTGTAVYIPKGQFILERGLGQRFGYYLEASWGIRNAIGLTLAFEGVSNAPPKNFVAHLELPVLSFLQLFGSYYLRGVNSFDELAMLGPFGLKSILFAGARLRVLPFLFINGRVYKTFRVNPTLERYDNQFGFSVDLELGYEFQKRDPAPPPKEEPAPTTPGPSPTPSTPQLPNPAEQGQPMSPAGMR
ncbi:MAG: hypothetical protein JNM17_25145 [Archangium sp.]|nr:hypothetical protein [Archangium sp.]